MDSIVAPQVGLERWLYKLWIATPLAFLAWTALTCPCKRVMDCHEEMYWVLMIISGIGTWWSIHA